MAGVTPVADFICRGKCAKAKGGAVMYELPIDAKRCPVCGSKRVERVFNKIGVIGTRPAAQAPEPDMRLTSSSPYTRSTALLDHGMSQWGAVQSSARSVPTETRPVSSLGGPSGISKPMAETQVQAAIREERIQNAMLARRTGKPGVAKLPTGLETQRRMNRDPIPTIEHHDPREPRATRSA